ncbi:MAG: hypothetical protein L0387_21885 [Acidobacteria bacterium]|nr:hypothetical protein [Acidobacteriota bacterium]
MKTFRIILCSVTLLIPILQVFLAGELAREFSQRFTGLLSYPIQRKPLQAQFEEKYFKNAPGGQVALPAISGEVYRDQDGRIRKNYRRQIAREPVLNGALIHDPNLEIAHTLDTDANTFLSARFPSLPGESAKGKIFPPHYPPERPNRENLGDRQLEGLTCRGVRRFEREDVLVEVWVAHELNSEVIRETKTKGDEQITYRLFNIRRVEPDASLFSVTSGYTDPNKKP